MVRPDSIIAPRTHHNVLDPLAKTAGIGPVFFLATTGILTAFLRGAARVDSYPVHPYTIYLVAAGTKVTGSKSANRLAA